VEKFRFEKFKSKVIYLPNKTKFPLSVCVGSCVCMVGCAGAGGCCGGEGGRCCI